MTAVRASLPLLAGLLILAAPSGAAARAEVLKLEIASTGKRSIDKKLSELTAKAVRKRLDLLGIKKAKVKVVSDRAVSVAVKREEDAETVMRVLLKPSRLEFREVVESYVLGGEPPAALPPGTEILHEYRLEGDRLSRVHYLVKKKVLLSGDIVESAKAGIHEQTAMPTVELLLNKRGAAEFHETTRESIGKSVAIVVDGNVVSAPVIRSPIPGGRIVIAGGFSLEGARDIALALNSGPLPAELLRIDRTASTAETTSKSDVDDPEWAATPVRKRDYAVVIGIERYRQGLRRADHAANDARIMTRYMTLRMGFKPENVVTLIDERAAKSDFEKYFEGWLSDRARRDGTVFVYYSGHGAPDVKSGNAYLVPYDGDPAFIDQTGYPLERLYSVLAKLPARAVVMLDACFSGAGGRSVAPKGARPLVLRVKRRAPEGGTLVLAASSGDQISSTHEDKSHGLFTYFLLKGLSGAADSDKDGDIEAGELFDFAKGRVESSARELYHNEQTPRLLGPAEARTIKMVR